MNEQTWISTTGKDGRWPTAEDFGPEKAVEYIYGGGSRFVVYWVHQERPCTATYWRPVTLPPPPVECTAAEMQAEADERWAKVFRAPTFCMNVPSWADSLLSARRLGRKDIERLVEAVLERNRDGVFYAGHPSIMDIARDLDAKYFKNQT